MNKYSIKALATKLFGRSVIIIAYLIIGFIFLSLPRFYSWLYEDKQLHIYAFTDLISFETIKKFKEQYGIDVSIKYFDSNEELFAKFQISKGAGYDVITPSYNLVELLGKENMLAPLDHDKLTNIKSIDERLLGLRYDPQNKYALPLAWSPYGVVYNKKVFGDLSEASLSLFFKNPTEQHLSVTRPYKICMIDDSRDAVFLASLYLFGSSESITDDKLQQIEELLIKQKSWIDVYLDMDLQYFLASRMIDIAIAPALYARRLLESSDDFGFKIPKEGSILTLETLAIPAQSKQKERAHLFINFLLSTEIATINSKRFGYNPANKYVYRAFDKSMLNKKDIFPDEKLFATLHLINNELSIKKLQQVWLNVKSR